MVRTLTLLLLVPFCSFLIAGSGGPDAFGYTWKDDLEPDGPVFNWIDITTTGVQVTGLADDNVVGPYVMETNFEYYWYNRKLVWIGSNGYIAFTSGNIASPFPNIPLAGGTNDYITGMMADLNFAGAGNPAQCWFLDEEYSTIISFINVPFWSPLAPSYTGSNTFQIIMNKQDSTVTVQILQQTGLTQNNDLTMGIESVAGSIGLEHSKNIYPPSNRAIRYYRPVVPLIDVTDVAVDWNTAPGSGGLFLSGNGPSFELVTRVHNIGNTAVGSFAVNGAVLNALNQIQVTGQVTVPGLIPTMDSVIVYPTPFLPVTPGTYTYRSTVVGVTGDLVPPNDQRFQELVVVDTTALIQNLNYHGTTDDGVGLSWTGGNGGIGVHIIPPYYPAYATHTTVRIVSNLGVAGFYMRVYDDDGPNGGPGSLLDEVSIPAAQATAGDHVVPLNTPIEITAGGVYVQWYMQVENINIARDANPPFSLRSYEVLDNTWAEYRDRENTDFFIGLRLSQAPVIDVGCNSFFGIVDQDVIGMSTTVRTFIGNHGNQPISQIPVAYRYGTGPAVEEVYTGTPIQPGQEVLYSFAQALDPWDHAEGTGELCAWTALPADATAENDTTCINLIIALGIAEHQGIEISVAPNPATDHVRLEGLPPDLYTVELFEGSGRLVGSEVRRVELGPVLLNVSTLTDGIYHIRLTGDGSRYRATVVVQR